MAKGESSRDENLISAASDVIRLMTQPLDESLEVQFIQLFKQKAEKLLEQKGRLDLGFGPQVTKSGEFFSEDMQVIMQYIEEETKRKYFFLEGQLLIYITEGYATGIWISDRPR